MTKIILTTGGTGGHVFPALAVAEELQAKGVQCLFIGTIHGPERVWVEQAGLEYIGLPVKGVLGRGFKAVGAIASLLKATLTARKIIKNFQPQVIAGFGSYASFAPLLAGALGNIPCLVHEQNAFAGLSNRLLGRLAKVVCLSLPDNVQAFDPTKSVFTGNPVRKSIALANIQPRQPDGRKHILILGGSQGAKAINSLILGSLPRLMEQEISLWHQCGDRDFDRVSAGYKAYNYNIEAEKTRVQPFISDMAAAYAWADLVICRSGASTVAELSIMGKAALYIPFPYATHDHQSYNAKVMVEGEAALMFSEKQIMEIDCIGKVIQLLADESALKTMGQKSKSLARPKAAEAVAEQILKLAQART